jgi:hypothetical protein
LDSPTCSKRSAVHYLVRCSLLEGKALLSGRSVGNTERVHRGVVLADFRPSTVTNDYFYCFHCSNMSETDEYARIAAPIDAIRDEGAAVDAAHEYPVSGQSYPTPSKRTPPIPRPSNTGAVRAHTESALRCRVTAGASTRDSSPLATRNPRPRKSKPPPHSCVCCASGSVERAQVLKGKPGNRRVASADGLICDGCGWRTCNRCIKGIHERCQALPKHARDHDSWYLTMDTYLTSGLKPEQWVGHCCEWRSEQDTSDVTSEVPNGGEYAGFLFAQEFGLLIGSPTTCVDIHGLAQIPGYISGVVHCVLSRKAAIRYELEGVHPSGPLKYER